MGAEDRVDLAVYYPASRDLAAWRERHARGEAPDLWPYGLDRLNGPAGHVEARSLPAECGAGAGRSLSSAPNHRRGPVIAAGTTQRS